MYLLLIFAFCCASALAESTQYYAPEDAALYFEDFIKEFDRHYADEDEKAARFEIFKAKLEEINRFNKESDHAVFGITQFSDLTSEEFSQRYTGLRDVGMSYECDTILTDADIPDSGAPEALDWRSSNVVTPVKNQGRCGSCYAFGTTGHLEALYAIKHGQLVSLSAQQIIDCDRLSLSCLGGLPALSMRELIRMGGSVSEKSYPYTANIQTCRFNLTDVVVKLSACYSYNLTSQEKVKQLLHKTGPIPIAIQTNMLYSYKSGILSDRLCCVGDINHAVLLVGYGTENGKPYWIAKNSWGVKFGDQGYFKMERSNNRAGACGMLNDKMATAEIK